MPIELTTRVVKSNDQVSCDLNGEVAVLNLKSTLYFGLDEVGAAAWNALTEPKVASDVCKAVYDQFDVDERRCQQDVLVFLNKLEQAGLISAVE